MTEPDCAEMQLLIQADVDGELTPAEAARVGAHLEGCPGCAEAQAELSTLSKRLRREMPFYPASESLHAAVRAQVAAVAGPAEAVATAQGATKAQGPWWSRRPRPRLGGRVSFGAGFALAAGLAFALVLPLEGGGLADAVIAGHIRALQPGHLLDVVSTDQHTVKPWFDGRLDYAPPVKDLKADGFPLVGGRLDYLAGRPVAVLVYQRRQHVIELFLWPDRGHFGHGLAEGSLNGYNFLRWGGDVMAFWAVSDVNAGELADFVRLWRAT